MALGDTSFLLTGRGLFDKVAVHAEVRPDAIALQAGNMQISYQQLMAEATALAAEITEAIGIEGPRPVALVLEPTSDFVVAVLAILAAGHAYVPLNPSQPEALRGQMLKTARPALILTGASAGFGEAFETSRCSQARPGLALHPRACRDDARRLADDVIYVMFTSGTTGAQKAVPCPASGVPRLFAQPGYARFAPDERHLLLAPVSFDASNLELWGALLHGALLCILDRASMGVEEICAQIRRDGITTLWLTSGLFNLIVERDPNWLAGVRQILVGGDVVSPAHLRRAMATLPGCRFVNGYGPTECTTFALCCPITADLAAGDRIPIGRPIAETHALIVGATGAPVAKGERGELWLSGAGLSPGYLDRADLTAARFVTRSDGRGGTARFYRTGDACMERHDGQIEILGRFDDEVKILGQRVPMSEVVNLLEAHPSVAQAAVVAVPRPGGQRQLAAAIVANGPGIDPQALRRHVGAFASRAHVPELIKVVAAMPLTPNGKIDRALVAALFEQNEMSREEPAPADLAQAWQDCLGVPATAESHFFDAGGSSLKAMCFILEVEALTGKRLGLDDLFQAPRFEAFRARVAAAPERPEAGHLVTLRAGGAATPVIVVHGGGGGVLQFRCLPTHLQPDRPVFALEGDWRAPAATPLSISELASGYLAEIDRRLPGRPVHLVGLCFGGHVAMDLALAMCDSGRPVRSLTLADTACIAGAPGRIGLYLAVYRFGRMLRHAARGRPSLAGLSPFEFRMARALRSHKTDVWPGDLHLLTGAPTWQPNLLSQTQKWRLKCSGQLVVHRVEGKRSAMFASATMAGTGAALEAIFTAADMPERGGRS